jgi:hypothetical protein
MCDEIRTNVRLGGNKFLSASSMLEVLHQFRIKYRDGSSYAIWMEQQRKLFKVLKRSLESQHIYK